jgi:hypothetical protein
MTTFWSQRRPRLLLVSTAFAFALSACGGKTMVESDLGIKGAPDWVNKGTQVLNDRNGRLFHGVGSAPALGDESLQRSTADERARAEVARVFSTYMDVVSTDYAAAAGAGGKADADQAVSRQIKAVTRVNLSGAKIIARWLDRKANTVYALAELDLKHVKDTVQGSRNMNDDLRRYIERNADNIFDKVAAKGSAQ